MRSARLPLLLPLAILLATAQGQEQQTARIGDPKPKVAMVIRYCVIGYRRFGILRTFGCQLRVG